MHVTLTWSEVMQAAFVGVMRQTTNIRDRRTDRFPDTAFDGWGIHIEGCCGEMAAAKALGVYWSGAHGKLRAADIGDRFQVRTCTGRTTRRSLILYPDDADDAIFILVVGRVPSYDVVGWLHAREGKHQEFWWTNPDNGWSGFFVPADRMRPLGELKAATEAA